jgi:hypothetical protein
MCAARAASTTVSTPGPADPHHRIADEATFTKVTTDARHPAAVYFFRELDVLVDSAQRVATDFFTRPHLYTSFGDRPLAPRLAELHFRQGVDERIPSADQRRLIYRSVLGDPTAATPSGFPLLSGDLIAAASAFAERVYDTGEEMLRERVRTAHLPLRDYLTGLTGDALEWYAAEALAGITRERAYPILRNPGVCAVFGVTTPPREDWPYTPDPNADKLIEEITTQLPGPVVRRESVCHRQRAALRGAEAIIAVLDLADGGTPEQLTALITRCYTWGAALNGLAAAATPLPLTSGE